MLVVLNWIFFMLLLAKYNTTHNITCLFAFYYVLRFLYLSGIVNSCILREERHGIWHITFQFTQHFYQDSHGLFRNKWNKYVYSWLNNSIMLRDFFFFTLFSKYIWQTKVNSKQTEELVASYVFFDYRLLKQGSLPVYRFKTTRELVSEKIMTTLLVCLFAFRRLLSIIMEHDRRMMKRRKKETGFW